MNGPPLSIARIGGDARRDLVGRPWAVPDSGADRSSSGHRLATRHLTRLLQSVLVIPLTTNLDRARLAGSALINASEGGLERDSVALAFQMRAIPKKCLKTLVRALTVEELAELDLATDEALGRVEPKTETE